MLLFPFHYSIGILLLPLENIIEKTQGVQTLMLPSHSEFDLMFITFYFVYQPVLILMTSYEK